MKKTLLLLSLCATSMCYGQTGRARLVFNNAGGTAYMVFNPDPRPAFNSGAYLVLDSKGPDAITLLPAAPVATGNIRSEAPQNKIRWAVSDTLHATPYLIPYGNQANVGLPFSLVKTSAAGGAGSFVCATYSSYPFMASSPYAGAAPAGTEWDNRNYMAPAGVTHMNDFALGSVDNSFNAVNRFWIVDAQETNAALWTNYAVKPTVVMNFENPYGDIDVAAPADVLVPGPGAGSTTLQAQRFNTTLQKWGDYVSAPTSVYSAQQTTSRVTGVAIGGANFFRAWTLSSVGSPLPIELTSWKGTCEGKEVKLSWTTATESNNDYFTIEKSRDALAWETIGEVDAVGNSISETQYGFNDDRTDGLAYYRLSQTDNDGTNVVFDVIAAGCDANSTQIVNAWDDGVNVNVLVSSTQAGVYDMYLMDAAGKNMVIRASQTINKNFTQLTFGKNGVARGMYTITLQNNDNVMSRRIVLM